jgi:hypothetical protein
MAIGASSASPEFAALAPCLSSGLIAVVGDFRRISKADKFRDVRIGHDHGPAFLGDGPRLRRDEIQRVVKEAVGIGSGGLKERDIRVDIALPRPDQRRRHPGALAGPGLAVICEALPTMGAQRRAQAGSFRSGASRRRPGPGRSRERRYRPRRAAALRRLVWRPRHTRPAPQCVSDSGSPGRNDTRQPLLFRLGQARAAEAGLAGLSLAEHQAISGAAA